MVHSAWVRTCLQAYLRIEALRTKVPRWHLGLGHLPLFSQTQMPKTRVTQT